MSSKSANSHGNTSEFLQAALAFDHALGGFHRAVEAAQRGSLGSAKQLERAAQSLEQVAQAEQQLRASSQVLSAALLGAQKQQVEEMQQLSERAQHIATRTAQFQQLMEGYRALGAAGVALNGKALELMQRQKDAATALSTEAFAGEVAQLQQSLGTVAQTALELLEAARTADFEDIVRQVDSVRQQLLSVRNRLSLFSR